MVFIHWRAAPLCGRRRTALSCLGGAVTAAIDEGSLLEAVGQSEVVSGSREAQPWSIRGYIVGACVFVLTCAVYVSALGGDFIWDDHSLLTENSRLRELKSLWFYLTSSFWGTSEQDVDGRIYYRPLSLLSLAIDYRLHGDNPTGYHVTNLLFHASNASLLFGLLRKRGLDAIRSAILSVMWAWFPRLTEAAAWISGRTDVLATTFVLIGLYLTPARSWLRRCAAALSLLIGLFAKEVAMAGVLGCLVLEWHEATGLPVWRRLQRLLPFFGILLVYTALRTYAVGAALRPNGLPWADRFPSGAEALGRYAWMLVDGWHPSTRVGALDDRTWGFVGLGGLVVLAIVAGVAWLIRRSRAGRPVLDPSGQSALAVLAVSVFLVLHIVPITVNVVAADRFLYLPVAALVLLLAPLLRDRSLRHPAWILVLLCTLSYAPTTVARSLVWNDEIDFWTTAFKEQRTRNASSRLELGNVYARAGMHSAATAVYLDAETSDDFNYAMTLNNLAVRLLFLGRAKDAEAVQRQVVSRAPHIPKFQFALASIYLAENKFDLALEHVRIAKRLFPKNSAYTKFEETTEDLKKEGERPPFNPDNTRDLLAQASLDSRCFRYKEAIDSLLLASQRPDITLRDLNDMMLFAFNTATPKQLTELYERYRAHGGNSPEFAESYALRMRRVARLRALWPALAPYRTDPERLKHGPVIQIAKPTPSASSSL
ncbi:MAG TPA: hypothetical protein VFQ61_28765 [Polyangiaceae bacterium]|nr:hypothetical protein [Polyangiaceae bacterium]